MEDQQARLQQDLQGLRSRSDAGMEYARTLAKLDDLVVMLKSVHRRFSHDPAACQRSQSPNRRVRAPRARASQVASIQAVANLLSPVQRDLTAWSSAFPLIRAHLSAGQVEIIRQQSVTLARQLRQARDRFAADYGAPAGFNRTQQAARTLLDDTRMFWKGLRRGAGSPAAKPESIWLADCRRMHGDIEEIDRTYRVLIGMCEHLPQRAEEVTLFNDLLAQLQTKLSIVDGLSPEQGVFLEKVQRGNAILDDITEPLLTWCKEEGLAGLLKVTF